MSRLARLGELAARNRVSVAVFLIPLVVYLAAFFASGEALVPKPDGFYSWLFARSLVFDGDFDFANDYALCGDEFDIGISYGTGHPDNPYYAGPALFWAPGLFVLRFAWTLIWGAAAAARASCGSWMTVLGLLPGPIVGAATVWLSYRTARLLVSERAAAATALLFAFTSPLFGYSSAIAVYSHVYLSLCVAVVTYIAFRAVASPSPASARAWYAVMAALAVAVLHRLPAVLYAVIPAAAALVLLRERARGRWLAAASAVVGPALGIGLTLALYAYLYGSIFVTPQGRYYVHLAEPHPFLLLFGVQGGFFFWMPAAWLGVAGAVLALRRWPMRVRLVAVACLVAAFCEVYISSSALDWGARWTLGARRLLPLTPMLIVFAAEAVERFLAWIPQRWRAFDMAAGAVTALVVINNWPSLMDRSYQNHPLTQAELYGACSPFRPLWALADRYIGDVALLPAEWYVRARYGLSVAGYRALHPSRFTLGLRNLVVESDDISFKEAWLQETSSGFSFVADGAHMANREARLVFASEWPSATHVSLLAKAEEPVEIRILRAGESEPFATWNLGPTGEATWSEVKVTRPPLASGINEWVFRTEAPSKVTLIAMKLDDRAHPLPIGNASTQSEVKR